MVLKIRLARFGKANKPFFNIVVAQARASRKAKPLEVLGTYDPVPQAPRYGEDPKPVKDIKLDISRAKYWLGVGAQPSDPAWRLLSMIGLLEPKFSVQKMQERERELRGAGGKGAGEAQSQDAVATVAGR